jgi:hypothetical protein
MYIIFIHGYSVTNTSHYGELPQALQNAAQQIGIHLDIKHIHLGRYISFNDAITMRDLTRALDRALHDLPQNSPDIIHPFSAITHSTGGSLLRLWIQHFYPGESLHQCPLTHFIQLAPPNHGAALAIIGKSRISRLKFLFNGTEPGLKVPDFLQLGSEASFQLNQQSLSHNYLKAGIFLSVHTGQAIDRSFYDFINNYLTEPGSDGVIRVAASSLNYHILTLRQTSTSILQAPPNLLQPDPSHPSPIHTIAQRIYNQYSHSGEDKGIMRSIQAANTQAPIVQDILVAIRVKTPQDYHQLTQQFQQKTDQNQHNTSRYTMVIITVDDNEGRRLKKDEFDLLFLAGKDYAPHQLTAGFMLDKQLNPQTGRITFYLNTDKIHNLPDDTIGLRINARPEQGFARYQSAEFRAQPNQVTQILHPNQTTYINIILHRIVDQNLFRFGTPDQGIIDFKKELPANKPVIND